MIRALLASLLIFMLGGCALFEDVTGLTPEQQCAEVSKALLAAQIVGADAGVIAKIQASVALYCTTP